MKRYRRKTGHHEWHIKYKKKDISVSDDEGSTSDESHSEELIRFSTPSYDEFSDNIRRGHTSSPVVFLNEMLRIDD